MELLAHATTLFNKTSVALIANSPIGMEPARRYSVVRRLILESNTSLARDVAEER